MTLTPLSKISLPTENCRVEKPPKRKPKHPYGDFLTVNTNTDEKVKTLGGRSYLYQLLPDREITGDCWRVFLALLCRLDFQNYVKICQREIADYLVIKPQNVSPIFKILERKGIIQRGEKVGSSYTFRLNPKLAWKGETPDLTVVLRRLEVEEIFPKPQK